MSRRTPGIQANSLIDNSIMDQVGEIVANMVRAIDEQIKINTAAGRNSYSHRLPTVFDLRVPRAEAQLLIYSELIETYRRKGFNDLQLCVSPSNEYSLVIKWQIGISPEEYERRRSLLREITQK